MPAHFRRGVLLFVLLLACGLAPWGHAAAPPIQTGNLLVVPRHADGARTPRFVTTTGGPAATSTFAQVSWDDRGLTLVFTCEDHEMVAQDRPRDDPDMWQDDSVEIFLDPGHTHDLQSAWIHVLVSAAGDVFDERGPVTQWFSNGNVMSADTSFDARNMTTQVQRTATGWTARVTLPWTDIGAKPKVGDVWGFNLHRSDQPDGEYQCFSPTHGPFYAIHQWGHLVFADAEGQLDGMSLAALSRELDQWHEEVLERSLTIGGVRYEAIDPGEPFTPAPVVVPDWTAPPATEPERAAGMMAYVTADPGEYRPDGIPKASERTDRLRTFMTPGEYEPVWFGVWGLSDVQHLSVTVEVGDAPVAVDVRYMHFWPQRTGWNSRQWYITPEMLLPCREGRQVVPKSRGVLTERAFHLKEGQTAAFWLTLHAEMDAAPGRYTLAVRIEGEGRDPLLLPLEVEILPFRLQRPTDRYWTLYCDAGRWNAMSDDQIMDELRDFARHGITGLVSIGLGSADLSGLAEGAVVFDASSYRRIATMAAEAGLPGPHIIRAWNASAVRDAVAPGADLDQGPWPDDVKAGVAAVARAAVEATRDLPPWYFYGLDEPAGDNTYALQDYQAWHAGGARTFATVSHLEFAQRAADYLTAPSFFVPHISDPHRANEVVQTLVRGDSEFWWYGTGCYVNPFPQEGMMLPNRYGAGLLFWKSGARGQAIWTYCRPHEDVFNDFDGLRVNRPEPKDQCLVYPHLLEPDDWRTYQGAIPTIAWEALREGADDFAYLYTLAQLIAQAREQDSDEAQLLADRAEAVLVELVDGVPWASSVEEPVFANDRLQEARRQAADAIVALRAGLDSIHEPVAE